MVLSSGGKDPTPAFLSLLSLPNLYSTSRYWNKKESFWTGRRVCGGCLSLGISVSVLRSDQENPEEREGGDL
jgi:hypothetical protein